MIKVRNIGIFLIAALVIMFQSCIHEYPVATHSPFPGTDSGGEKDPTTTTDVLLDVEYLLSWESLLHKVEFSPETKARDDRPYRFVVEVVKNDKVICHDIENITANEFASGKFQHKLSVPLSATDYQIAVWCDLQNEDGEYPFITDNLNKVTVSRLSTTDAEAMVCAFGSEVLDLTGVNMENETLVTKEIELKHPGARFEIVATDIQQFITQNKPSLEQGDKFTAHLSFSKGTTHSFNLHTGKLVYGVEDLLLSGRMRLPFDEYEELVIAEGFIFCDEEDEVTVKLDVKNSALVNVSTTDYFTFPVKRGYITTIRGDFLSNPIEGVFSVNNIWAGEIEIYI